MHLKEMAKEIEATVQLKLNGYVQCSIEAETKITKNKVLDRPT